MFNSNTYAMNWKKYLMGMSVLALLSCESTPEPDPDDPRVVNPEEEVFPVKFSLSLKEEVIPFPETRAIPPLNIGEPVAVERNETPKAIEELCSTIEYIVFKEGETVPYREITYAKEDLDFGVISDELPRGEYQFFVVAHNSSTATLDEKTLSFDRVTDTFHYTFYLNILPGDIHQESITLYRVVSKVEFVSTDIVPVGAQTFSIQLDKHACQLDLTTGHGLYPETQTPLFTYALTDHVGSSGITHSFFTFVPESGALLSANLKTTDTEDAILRERTVDNIQPIANKIIRYIGQLYNSSHSEEEFVITLAEDGEWGETIETDIGD